MHKRPASLRPNAGATVRRFLADVLADGGASSPLALVAKASALYDRTSYLAAYLDRSQSSLAHAVFAHRRLTGAPLTDAGGVEGALRELDSAVETFKASLPSLDRAGALPGEQAHSLLLIHCLCHCATIQLHRAFVARSSTSMTRCLASANTVVRVAQELTRHAAVVSPVVGVRAFRRPAAQYIADRSSRCSRARRARCCCAACGRSGPRGRRGRRPRRCRARKNSCNRSGSSWRRWRG